jgi:hypothetical protein
LALLNDIIDAHTQCNTALANWTGPPAPQNWQLEIASLTSAITGLSQHEPNGAVTGLRQMLEQSRNPLQANPPPNHPAQIQKNFCTHARNTARAYRRVLELGL